MPTGKKPKRSNPKKHRAYQRRIMAAKRILEREIGPIPAVKNPRRRRKCLRNTERFLSVYFPKIFYNSFTKDQREQIKCITDRMIVGGLQALAASRGDGKSSITRIVGAFFGPLNGYVKYLVLLGANAGYAENMLDDIKEEYETNPILYEDFPEICHPVRCLEGAASRGSAQTLNGERTRLKWSGKFIRLPRITGSKASGVMITTRGVDSAIRGLVRGAIRPDVIICDDVETRDSARSATETAARMETIKQDVLPLGGPGKKISVAYLCTIIKRGCIADQLTDRKLSPAWHGLRQKFLVKEPNDKKAWDTYIELRQRDQMNGDETARTAHAYYLDNREAMDRGAVTNNPKRYKDIDLPDGSKIEVSAIQHAYNLIADMGRNPFAAEYQNEPAELESLETVGLTATAIQNRCNGIGKGIVPEYDKITAGVDVGGRLLYWVLMSWKQGLIGHVVDYGVGQIHSPLSGKLTSPENKQALEQAIQTALIMWRDYMQIGWPSMDLTMIDAGWQDKAVYNFLKLTRDKKYRAAKGAGSVEKTNYRPPRKSDKYKKVGHKFYKTYEPTEGLWVYHNDADYWKLQVQNGFLVAVGKPGSITLWGNDPYPHRTYAKHIVSEVWTREFVVGKGTKEYFHVADESNHYLDATYLAAAAAAVCGIKVLPISTEEPKRVENKDAQTVTMKVQRRRQVQQKIATPYTDDVGGDVMEGLPEDLI